MAAACPECGHRARGERDFGRTRRRWRLVVAAAVLLMGGAAVAALPAARGGRWHRWVPNTALIVCLPWAEQAWVWDELDRRIDGVLGPVSWHRRDALWGWQWRLLTVRAGAAVDADLPQAIRVRALYTVLDKVLDPGPAAGVVARAAVDDDVKVRGLAAWGIKAARHDWDVATRQSFIAALRAAPDDTIRNGHSRRNLAIGMLESLPANDPAAELHTGVPGPAEVLGRLSGADTAALSRVYGELGVTSRMLTWSYDGESGPLRTMRLDLDLDGAAGLDCIIHVSDHFDTHGEMLVFLQRSSGWRSIDCLSIAGRGVRAPTVRAVPRPGGGGWLVITADAGSDGPGGGYALFGDAWFTVEPRGIRPAGWVFGEGYMRGPTRAGGLPVRWEWTSGPPRVLKGGGETMVEYDVKVAAAAGWTGAWDSLQAPDLSLGAGELFTVERTIRFRWNGGGFEPMLASGSWASDKAILDALLGGPDEFLAEAAGDLAPIAAGGTESQRRWLFLFLGECKPSPARDNLLRLLRTGAADP